MKGPYYKVPRAFLNDVIVYLKKGQWDEVNQMMVVIQTSVEGPWEDGENGVPRLLKAVTGETGTTEASATASSSANTGSPTT